MNPSDLSKPDLLFCIHHPIQNSEFGFSRGKWSRHSSRTSYPRQKRHYCFSLMVPSRLTNSLQQPRISDTNSDFVRENTQPATSHRSITISQLHELSSDETKTRLQWTIQPKYSRTSQLFFSHQPLMPEHTLLPHPPEWVRTMIPLQLPRPNVLPLIVISINPCEVAVTCVVSATAQVE